jgi:glycosyltransferase involved in cell wall biosynthesis
MSEYLRRSFVADFEVSDQAVRTVFAGANLDLARVVPRSRICEGPPTILFVGRQWERKGGPVVIEAFREVRKVVPSARLRIVGCTPEVGDEPGVEVLGRIQKDVSGGEDRLADLYQTSDVFCMPSRFEPFGIVFVEAMLHGLPCIGTSRFAMPEIIEEGGTGWLIAEDDATALGRRLVTALTDREGSFAMGQRGRARALDLFTWETVAASIVRGMEEKI